MSRHKNYSEAKAGDVLWIGSKSVPLSFVGDDGVTMGGTHFRYSQLKALDAEIEPKQKRVKFITRGFIAGSGMTSCIWLRNEDLDLAKKLLEDGLPE